jgi:hypothetical protein
MKVNIMIGQEENGNKLEGEVQEAETEGVVEEAVISMLALVVPP